MQSLFILWVVSVPHFFLLFLFINHPLCRLILILLHRIYSFGPSLHLSSPMHLWLSIFLWVSYAISFLFLHWLHSVSITIKQIFMLVISLHLTCLSIMHSNHPLFILISIFVIMLIIHIFYIRICCYLLFWLICQ